MRDNARKTLLLQTETTNDGCNGICQKIRWVAPSPQLQVFVTTAPGSQLHEEGHIWGYIFAYKNAKSKMEKYMNRCFNGLRLRMAEKSIEAARMWAHRLCNYLNLGLHIGKHPQFGERYEYPKNDKERKQQEAMYPEVFQSLTDAANEMEVAGKIFDAIKKGEGECE